MKTTNRPKKDSLPVVKPPQPKTSAERFAQQRRIHLKLKAKLKAQPKTVTPGISTKPVPKAQPPKRLVFNSATISAAPAPVFSPATMKAFSMATKALKGTRRLSEKLTIAGYHLQSDPLLSTINPAELLRELNAENE